MNKRYFLAGAALWLIHLAAPAGSLAQNKLAPSHADKISRYEGPQTCRACHAETFRDVAVSLHYQQMAEPQFLVDWPKGQLAGQAWSF